MPILKRDDQILHFIHIPKTGGSSVSQLLQSEGWKTSPPPPLPNDMMNEILAFTKAGRPLSGHQHASLWKLWDESVDYRFAMVRNPYERFASQCRQIAKAEGHDNISPTYVLEKFEYVYNEVIPKLGLGADDNHMRPQHEFIDDTTRVFRLEDQRHRLLEFLKERNLISSSCVLPYANVSFKDAPHTIVHWPFNALLHMQFLLLYGHDFDKFDYSREVPTYGLNINWKKYDD